MLIWLALLGCSGAEDVAGSSAFRIVVSADSHLIDAYYTCCESNDLDTESLQFSRERLEAARDAIEALDPRPEAVFVAGDIVHEYPSDDWDFYFENETAFDHVSEVYGQFSMPVHVGLGNHDYDVPRSSRAFTHQLIAEKWGVEPYYAVEYHGWKFIHLDCQGGDTWDPEQPLYDRDFGSFGAEQLAWLDEELAEGKPSVLFFHNPPLLIRASERPDDALTDLFQVVDAHTDVVQAIFTGHMHLWMDFTSAWPVPGWGLAATRYDSRNFWVVDIDPEAGTLEIPQLDDAAWGRSSTSTRPPRSIGWTATRSTSIPSCSCASGSDSPSCRD